MARRSNRSLAQSEAMRRYWARKKARQAEATPTRKVRKEVLDALETLNRFIKRNAA